TASQFHLWAAYRTFTSTHMTSECATSARRLGVPRRRTFSAEKETRQFRNRTSNNSFRNFNFIERVLKFLGVYARGRRNAEEIRIQHHRISVGIPLTFHNFTILQLSHLHIDLNPGIVPRPIKIAATP